MVAGKPLAIDLFCGLGGWTEPLLAEGWNVIGYDIERHVYGDSFYPGVLVLQSVLDLHGSMFRNVDLIVASPPCQAYSYMAMPWSRGKKMAEEIRHSSEKREELNRLFNACFRIQREAIAASAKDCPSCGGKGFVIWYVGDTRPCEICDGKGWVTRHIPMVVENVRGAQPWVGRAKWNYGSFYLWGDVPALMPFRRLVPLKVAGFNFHQHENGKPGGSFQTAAVDGMAHAPHYQARKAASAQIAKIPYALASHIARVYRPC